MVNVERIIKAIGRQNIITDQLELISYSRDMSVHRGVPECIVKVSSKEMVSELLKLANSEKFAVIPRGAGSSVTGAILPVKPSVICDLSSMNKIKEINHEDRLGVVEPGVVCAKLNEEAALRSLFFAPEPGSSSVATIGGMVALNASGLRAVKYGTTKDHILGLEVVLPDGSIIRTGTRAPKTSFGYDLTRLFVSSEGTLGIITEITVKLTPLPQYIAVATAYFDELEAAGRSVSKILAEGIGLSICEIMDRVSIDVVNSQTELNLKPAEALLIMEVDGHPEAVKDEIKKIVSICKKEGATEAISTDEPDERIKIWQGRKGLVSSLSRIKPGCRLIPIAEDFGVPISKIPATIKGAQQIAKRLEAMVATFGHVGDGNVHTTFIGDVRDKDDWEKLREAASHLVRLVAEMNGTMSAEHGIGIAKSAFAKMSLGASLNWMKKIKEVFDPNQILNPGKLGFDEKEADIYDHFAFNEIMQSRSEAPLGRKIEDELLLCVQCGFCRAVCPTFTISEMESMNARGRNILAYCISDGTVELSKPLANKFFSCTTCLSCKYACPSSIDVAEIIIAVRKKLSNDNLAPEPVKTVSNNIVKKQNPFALDQQKRLDVFPKQLREKIKSAPFPGGKTLLWLGCITSLADMKIVPSTIKIMGRSGENYTTLGQKEGCCGYFLYLAGDERFEQIAKKNIEQFKSMGIEKIITPCAGCYRTFKSLYGEVAKGWGDIDVIHITQLIEEMIKREKIEIKDGFSTSVAYHDPCDLGRHMQVFDPPRGILQALAGENFIEFRRNRQNSFCCGGGGGLAAFDSEMSLEISDMRMKEAVEIGAEVVVSACGSCKTNLKKSGMRVKKLLGLEKPIKVMDITELVARFIKNGKVPA